MLPYEEKKPGIFTSWLAMFGNIYLEIICDFVVISACDF